MTTVIALNSITSRSLHLASQLSDDEILTLWTYIDGLCILENPSGVAMQFRVDENNVDTWAMAMKLMEVIGNAYISHYTPLQNANKTIHRIDTMVAIIREILQCCHSEIIHDDSIVFKIGKPLLPLLYLIHHLIMIPHHLCFY